MESTARSSIRNMRVPVQAACQSKELWTCPDGRKAHMFALSSHRRGAGEEGAEGYIDVGICLVSLSSGGYLDTVKSHEQIDARSLVLARRIVSTIDEEPRREGLAKAREVCRRWYRDNPVPAVAEWLRILDGSWDTVRSVLLDEGEEGRRLRQSSPFCGILSARERLAILRRFSHEPKTT